MKLSKKNLLIFTFFLVLAGCDYPEDNLSSDERAKLGELQFLLRHASYLNDKKIGITDNITWYGTRYGTNVGFGREEGYTGLFYRENEYLYTYQGLGKELKKVYRVKYTKSSKAINEDHLSRLEYRMYYSGSLEDDEVIKITAEHHKKYSELYQERQNAYVSGYQGQSSLKKTKDTERYYNALLKGFRIHKILYANEAYKNKKIVLCLASYPILASSEKNFIGIEKNKWNYENVIAVLTEDEKNITLEGYLEIGENRHRVIDFGIRKSNEIKGFFEIFVYYEYLNKNGNGYDQPLILYNFYLLKE